MTGYATSAQALETLAGDYLENYESLATWDLNASRGYRFFATASNIVGGLFTAQGVFVGSLPSGIVGALHIAMGEYYHGESLKRRTQADLATAVMKNWSERDQTNPLFYLPKKKRFSRTEAEREARPVKPFDTVEELLERTSPDEFGLVNAVLTKPRYEQTMVGNGLVPVSNGVEVPQAKLTLGEEFKEHSHVLLIGYALKGMYQHLSARPAVTIDKYRQRKPKQKPALEPTSGLLWTPSPVRV